MVESSPELRHVKAKATRDFLDVSPDKNAYFLCKAVSDEGEKIIARIECQRPCGDVQGADININSVQGLVLRSDTINCVELYNGLDTRVLKFDVFDEEANPTGVVKIDRSDVFAGGNVSIETATLTEK